MCLTTHSRKGEPGHVLRVWKWCLNQPFTFPIRASYLCKRPRPSPASYLAFWSTKCTPQCMQGQIICPDFGKQCCILQIIPFILMRNSVFFSEEDNSILSPVEETWKQTKPLLASTCPKKFNLFFQRSCYSFIHGSGSAFSLSSLVASAFSSASFKCTEHLQ